MLAPTPDFSQFLAMLRREQPDRPVLYEHYIEWPILIAALGEDLLPQDDPPWGWCMNIARGFARLGYDTAPLYLSAPLNFSFLKPREAAEKSIGTGEKTRSQNADALITDAKSLSAYPWPDPADYPAGDLLNAIATGIPAGMKLVAYAPCGIFEALVELFGFDNLCLLVYDDPELVMRTCAEIGSRTVTFLRGCLGHEVVGAFCICDDMGYKTSTMLAPDMLRSLVLPWHRACVAEAHACGKPAILHCCGQVDAIMDDIIDTCGYDAKHSFEDVILPVEDIYRRYGDRIAILGGFDVDFMNRATPAAIAQRTRAILQQTGCRGYALGSGNSLTDSMPRENLDALWQSARDIGTFP